MIYNKFKLTLIYHIILVNIIQLYYYYIINYTFYILL